MSSRLGTKSMKRASSTSKKKGSSGTPDSNTPTASGASIGLDKPQDSTIDDVLVGNEVEALRIKEEDLIKVHPPKPPSASRPAQHKRKVVVRRDQHQGRARSPNSTEKKVAVLQPLPPGTAITATRTIGSVEGGPRFDHRGTFLSHSVLGATEDYAAELKTRHMVGSASAFVKSPPVVLPDVKKKPESKTMGYKDTILPREKRALKFWDESMEHRKAQQHHLCNEIDSVPERLLMNRGDTYRGVQEERMLIDRTMPSVNCDKGYQVGNEFWSQSVQIGSQDTGIHTTLTLTEQGLPPELEFVGVPAVTLKERGTTRDLEKNAPAHYTWDQSLYLTTRKQQLAGPLTDMHRPEMSELEVLGKALTGDGALLRTDSLDSLGESASSEGEDVPGSILDLHADTASQPIIGPALLVNGQLLQWEGPPLPEVQDRPPPQGPSRATQSESALDMVKPQESTASLRALDMKRRVSFNSSPITFRVNLESETSAIVTSPVELENCGTTTVYYSWQPLPNPNPLGTIQAGDTQRFYFDTRGGVLLPRQRIKFPITFKSPNAGIFSETWLFQTGPVLCRGRQVVFTLKGVAFQEDLNTHKREELERELKNRMAEAAAERIINKIVESIRTPPHSPDPVPTVEMDEHVFKARNPELYYHHSVIQQLKALYDSILRPERLQADKLAAEPSTRSDKSGTTRKDDKGGGNKGKASGKDKKGGKAKDESIKEEVLPPSQDEEALLDVSDWDLSITSLQEIILGIEDVAVVESKLKELSALVGALSFPPPQQIKRNNYNIVYVALCEAIDLMCDVSTRLCQTMGLPVREFTRKDEAGSGDKQTETDVAPSQPASPAHGKDKKGGKDAKKAKGGKDALKSGSGKNKAMTQKKSKSTLSAKDPDTIKQTTSETNADVDPIMKKKYNDSFYALVYEILVAAAGKIEHLH